ncbi:MAG: hypothetical protein ACM3JP_00275 [Betaproteobacteria bacterium]
MLVHAPMKMAAAGLLAGMLMVLGASSAAAHPSTPSTLTYHLTDCSGPAGTPAQFDAVKQPGGAAALHLVDGSGMFIATQAVDVATGTVLFSTPGFGHNDLPTVTCLAIHPVTQTLQSVTGLLIPIG